VRIATKKVTALLERLADLRRREPAEEDDRIFPAMYVPLIVTENGRRVIKPMRLCLPACRGPADYDQRFPGTYNARRDSLTGFWNNVYGRRHGLMVVSGFYENVPRHLYERRELQAGEAVRSV
jgi:putative SOS response-associated peptidase YedK